MSKTTEVNTTPNAQASADPAPAPTTTSPDAIVAQLRAIRETIPDYQQLPLHDRRVLQIVAKGNNADFVQASINGAGASPVIQQALGQTPEELRQDTADAQSWSVVEDELRAMLTGVIAGNLVRFHRIGSSALATYGLAKRLVRQKAHADLLPHVDMMKKLNKFGSGKKSKTAVGTPAPAPGTTPVLTSTPVATAPPVATTTPVSTAQPKSET
jgi:hypothetical protein